MELPKKGMQSRLLLGSGHCTDLRSMHDFGFHAKSNKSFGEHEWSNDTQAFYAVTAHSKGALLRCTAHHIKSVELQQRVCFECLQEAVQSGPQAQ